MDIPNMAQINNALRTVNMVNPLTIKNEHKSMTLWEPLKTEDNANNGRKEVEDNHGN
jgi:hypothetical protein